MCVLERGVRDALKGGRIDAGGAGVARGAKERGVRRTALARRVLPVPGGPKSRTPRQGSLIPVKYSGMSMGSVMASFRRRFASSRLAMSSNDTCRRSVGKMVRPEE